MHWNRHVFYLFVVLNLILGWSMHWNNDKQQQIQVLVCSGHDLWLFTSSYNMDIIEITRSGSGYFWVVFLLHNLFIVNFGHQCSMRNWPRHLCVLLMWATTNMNIYVLLAASFWKYVQSSTQFRIFLTFVCNNCQAIQKTY